MNLELEIARALSNFGGSDGGPDLEHEIDGRLSELWLPGSGSPRGGRTEVQSELIPYGCTPCFLGRRACHKAIVADDGRCRPVPWADDYYYCRC